MKSASPVDSAFYPSRMVKMRLINGDGDCSSVAASLGRSVA